MYELRTYTGVPGRVPQIIEGLRANACSLFVRYGFRPLAFWETSDRAAEERSVVYLLEWRDVAEQQAGWAALKADPDWHAFLAETQRRGAAIARVTTVNLDAIPDMPLATAGQTGRPAS